jgi:hypothetical protein
VRFVIEQRFGFPPADVQAAVLDPAYLARLAELPNLGRPELLDQQHRGELVTQRVRYAFVGDLNSAVRKVVDPDRLTWVEVSNVDVARQTTSFTIEPDHYASMLTASGRIHITPDGDSGSLRLAEGDLRVRVPLVGGKVERAIVSGLQEHGAAEEDALAAWLAER